MVVVPKTTWILNNEEEIGSGDDIKIRKYGDKEGYYLEGNVLFVTEEYIEVADFEYNCGQIIYITEVEEILKLKTV